MATNSKYMEEIANQQLLTDAEERELAAKIKIGDAKALEELTKANLKFVVSLACIKMRLLPEEALNAATINGAYAMGLSADYGSIAIGKVANFYITHPIPSIAFIPYAYTTPVIREVYLNGERQN